MAASSAAIENAGKWSGSLPGCTTSAASSLDGNITSRTSSASSTLPAFTCCSDIYETGSSVFLTRGESSFSDLYIEGHRVGPAGVLDDELVLPVLLRRDLNRTLRSGRVV